MAEKTLQSDDTRSFEHELAGKYLTFQLKSEMYGCPISPINDIIEMKDITGVPQTRDYVEGVINLRGTVIPVINLRQKFGIEKGEYTRQTCIVVVELDDLQTGLIVDQVEEVLEVSDDQVDPAPSMGQEINREFISGMGKLNDDVIVLLNLNKVLTEEEAEELQNVQDSEQSEQ